MQKAPVFPEPVADCPTTSEPARIGGIAWSWIDVGVVQPSLSIASTRSAEIPSDENADVTGAGVPGEGGSWVKQQPWVGRRARGRPQGAGVEV